MVREPFEPLDASDSAGSVSTGSGYGSTPSESEGGSEASFGGFDPRDLEELPTVQQGALTMAQGVTGMRRWYLKGNCDLQNALRYICASHWPGFPDCLPVSVVWGAADEKVQVGEVFQGNINWNLPKYDQYLIVCQYQLMHIHDPWPITGKPAHPKGTSLTLQVRSSDEILEIDPTAMTDGAHGKGLTGCFTGIELAPSLVFNSRIRICLTEYHITCDRITDEQLCNIMRPGNRWKTRENTVNSDPWSPPKAAPGTDRDAGPPAGHGYFMNEAEGTLLFDSWTLDQTFVPDVDNPRRWRLGCVLKARQVPNMRGPYPGTEKGDCNNPAYAIGWNHDFKRNLQGELGWQFIMMQSAGAGDNARWTPHGKCRAGFVPRYPYEEFRDLFCDYPSDKCLPAEGVTCHGHAGSGSGASASGSASLGGSTSAGGSASVGDSTSVEGDALAQIVEDANGVQYRKRLREQR